MNLDELGILYKTDKSSRWHDFLNTYEKYFAPRKNDKLRILEIGVSGASSLRVWRDYFKNSYICGIDIDKNSLNYKEDGYDIFLCNQTDEKGLKMLVDQAGPFDIIIDDGSHFASHIIKSFEVLFPLLNNNGLYIIEDLHTMYLKEYNDGQNVYVYFCERINDINLGGKNINSDICGSKQRQFSRLEGKMDFTPEELSIQAIHLYPSVIIVEKKLLELKSNIQKEFLA